MTTHRYLVLFASLAASLVNAYAQPMVSMNTPNHSTESAPTAKAPHQPKATVEAPFYVKVYGFYGLITPGSQIPTNTSYNYTSSGMTTNSSSTFKTNSFGLGAGLRGGVGVGFIVSDFINLGIDADMLFSANLESTTDSKSTTYSYNTSTVTDFRVLSIIPNVTFKALSRPAYYIYNRLGLVGGIVMNYKTTQTTTNTASTPANSYVATVENNFRENSLAIGYQAAIGIQFRISQSLRGFAEVVAYNQSFKPKERLYTYIYTKAGSAPTTPSQNLYVYSREGDSSVTTKDSNGVTTYQQASYNVVMNSVGLGVGLLARF